ncbi:MAG: Maf family protein [Pseudomonadota bacterium]
MTELILSSASPRRAELLKAMDLEFTVRPADVDETPHDHESPWAYVQRLAGSKARASWRANTVSLGADTSVVVDGDILGKPLDEHDACAMLARLSDRWHAVTTAVAGFDGRRTVTQVVVTRVRFRHISAAEARRYWATGEGADKAGSYGIQGIGGIFVKGLRGSYSAVVGLPTQETERLLNMLDLDTWKMRRRG